MQLNVESINGRVREGRIYQIFSFKNYKLNLVGDGVTYFERGCAVHGEVSRREGRNCIERVGK